MGEAQERARAAGWDECVVVNDRRVVLGHLGKKALDGDPGLDASTVMDPGPVAIRPDSLLAGVIEHLRQVGVHRILVTTSGGELVGLLRREDAERKVHEAHATSLRG